MTKYCITIHIEVEADDIDEADDFAHDAVSKFHYPDDWSVDVNSAVVGDIEELGDD